MNSFNLDNLSITITAEAGRCSLSLHELMQLGENSIVDIANLPPKVVLYANDIIIGSGILVELNGRVGVKITQINANINHDFFSDDANNLSNLSDIEDQSHAELSVPVQDLEMREYNQINDTDDNFDDKDYEDDEDTGDDLDEIDQKFIEN